MKKLTEKQKRELLIEIGQEEELYAKDTFCPLLQARCNPDCVCFGHITIETLAQKKGHLVPDKDYGCRNTMFFGGNTCQNRE